VTGSNVSSGASHFSPKLPVKVESREWRESWAGNAAFVDGRDGQLVGRWNTWLCHRHLGLRPNISKLLGRNGVQANWKTVRFVITGVLE
jgi:hypothetical protein